MAAALQLASMTILPMLSLRLCRDAFFDGDDDEDDVSAVVASSDETAAVVSSSPGVVGVEPGPVWKQKRVRLSFLIPLRTLLDPSGTFWAQ